MHFKIYDDLATQKILECDQLIVSLGFLILQNIVNIFSMKEYSASCNCCMRVSLTLVRPIFFNPHCDNIGDVLVGGFDIPENKLQQFTFTRTTNTFFSLSSG